MSEFHKWTPTRVAPKFQPNTAPIPSVQQEVRRRRPSRRYIPPAFTWLKIMAWGNLCLGALMVCGIMVGLTKSGTDHKGWLLISLFLVAFVVTPIAVLTRLKIGFYLGLVMSIPLLIAFPVGTIIGFFTCKAFFDARETFGVR